MVKLLSKIILLMVMAFLGLDILIACGGKTPAPAQPSPERATDQMPATSPAGSTQLPAAPTALNGLYVGKYPNGEKAVAYLFKPSGAVAYDFYQSVVDPDDAASWPTIEVYVESEAEEKGYEPYRVNLGTYKLLGDSIRLNTHEQYIDSQKQVKFRETVFSDTFDQKDEQLSFRASSDLSTIMIGEAVLLRQADMTGTKLSGDFAQDGPATIRTSFTDDGRFSWSFLSTYNGPGATGNNYSDVTVTSQNEEGSGQYQVQGNEIILRYSDGTVKRRVFAYLGLENNREILAIGGWILEER